MNSINLNVLRMIALLIVSTVYWYLRKIFVPNAVKDIILI